MQYAIHYLSGDHKGSQHTDGIHCNRGSARIIPPCFRFSDEAGKILREWSLIAGEMASGLDKSALCSSHFLCKIYQQREDYQAFAKLPSCTFANLLTDAEALFPTKLKESGRFSRLSLVDLSKRGYR